MSGRVRTRVDRGTGEVVAYSDAAVRNNLAVIEYCRTSMAALSGATAGVYEEFCLKEKGSSIVLWFTNFLEA